MAPSTLAVTGSMLNSSGYTAAWNDAQTVLTVTPVGTWHAGTDVSLTVYCNVFDKSKYLYGTFAYTVQTPAVDPPPVVVVPPTASMVPILQSAIATTQPVQINFDQAMDPGSLVLAGTLADASDGGVWSDSNRTLTLSPVTTWPTNATLNLTLDAATPDGVPISTMTQSFQTSAFGYKQSVEFTGLFDNDGTWHDLGHSVAASGDTVVAGDPYAGFDIGRAVVFVRTEGIWSVQQVLPGFPNPDMPTLDMMFGMGVAIEGDTLAVSEPNEMFGGVWGGVHVYTRTDGVWAETQRIGGTPSVSSFSDQVAISGDTLAVNGYVFPETGPAYRAVHVLVKQDGTYVHQQTISLAIDDTAITGSWRPMVIALEGNTLAIGASQSNSAALDGEKGHVYIYTRSAGVWTQQTVLTAPDAHLNDWFGKSVMLKGGMLAVGAPGQGNGNAWECNTVWCFPAQGYGAVYLFTGSGASWTQTAKLVPAVSANDMLFGDSVAFEGNLLVAGATQQSSAMGKLTQRNGAAYVFEFDGTQWRERQTFVAGDKQYYGYFGEAVAIGSGFVAVGSEGLDVAPGQTSAGAVYFFEAP